MGIEEGWVGIEGRLGGYRGKGWLGCRGDG